ncbi:MAG: hypothetical protein RQ728_10910, partial [Brevefilum sp.]|nr:hypothetical protein [Brevefilum sp.]
MMQSELILKKFGRSGFSRFLDKAIRIFIILVYLLTTSGLSTMRVQAQTTDLELVQQNTTITGTLNNFTVTFPVDIPDSVLGAGYFINSRITLSTELPAGATLSVIKDGVPVYNDALPEGVTTIFWFTDLVDMPAS